jgi:hypothetical protein
MIGQEVLAPVPSKPGPPPLDATGFQLGDGCHLGKAYPDFARMLLSIAAATSALPAPEIGKHDDAHGATVTPGEHLWDRASRPSM